jgi:multiple sugar transport system substrate-binding protein
MIDHPHIGAIGMQTALVPLDDLLPRTYLEGQAADSVGPSYRSYTWNGHQWALAVDAAAQVGALRRDLLDSVGVDPPCMWDGVLALTEQLPAGMRFALPLAPIDAACNLMSIGVNLTGASFWDNERGYERGALDEAVDLLTRLAEAADPRSFALNPPALLDLMVSEDTVAYAPLIFGYSNYARQAPAERRVSFTDMPSHTDSPNGSVLGGVGLAVSAHSSFPQEAAEYAAFVAAAEVQRGVYFESGGQPGHRAAWTDAAVNEASGGFFASTLATLDDSFLRPRLGEDPSFLNKQAAIGELLSDALERRAGHREIVAGITRAAAT